MVKEKFEDLRDSCRNAINIIGHGKVQIGITLLLKNIKSYVKILYSQLVVWSG
jgi:hypothetical protein